MKDHHSKIFKLQAVRESVKRIQGAEIMGGSNLHKRSGYTVEKRRILCKCAKEIRERGEFAKVVYNRLVSY